MNRLSFIHLSDIHFHKNSGGAFDVDNDLREAILHDIQKNALSALGVVTGVLVSGDIAFSGKLLEYEKAGEFLKRVTDILGINESSVICVPGNHDVDQDKIRNSASLLGAQRLLEAKESLDEADEYLFHQMNDPEAPDLLFRHISAYNQFAVSYNCNLNENISYLVKEYKFSDMWDLEQNSLKLKIYGLNSVFISSADDYTNSGDKPRKMFVGQAQIPRYEEDVVTVSVCHHPIDLWKFADQIRERMDHRVFVQLYGHKHKQTIEKTKDCIRITAGAAHPVRGKDWQPRYNWISFEPFFDGDSRWIRVYIYPRVLAGDRDGFVCDFDVCERGEEYLVYEQNMDRRQEEQKGVLLQEHMELIPRRGEKYVTDDLDGRMLYAFLNLPNLSQDKILRELGLYKEEYRCRKNIDVIDKIVEDAKTSGCLRQFYKRIRKE